MADNEPTDVATLETEVAAARARFARTLDKLTDPATHEAMKNEVMERVEGYKDGLLGAVEASARAKGQGVVDDLKTRAMNNPAGAALIGAGIAYHLYRHPPITTLLVGAGTALLMRARGKRVSDPTAYRAPYDERQPRGYVPGGVAGYGYPVEEDAPGSTTTDRIMAEAAAAGGKARALASEVGERAREIGGRAREAASEAGSRIAETAERTRHAAADTLDRTRHAAADTLDRTRATAEDMAARARTTAHDAYERTAGAAEDAYERAGDVYDRVRTDPWLLGALGIAAGAALAVAMRRTETGDRFVGATTDMVGRGARGVGSTARAAASRAAEAASSVSESLGNAASSVTSAASGLAESVAGTWSGDSEPEPPRRGRGGQRRHSGSAQRGRDGDGDFMGSAAEAASSAYRGAAEQADYAARRAAGLAGRARDEVVDLAENYPLLLGAIGLAAGAAAGLALRPTQSEDELIGSYSDSLKSRARALATEQYQEVVGAAQDLADAFAEPSGGKSPGADPAPDWETVIGGGAPQQAGRPGTGMGPKV
jgi:hypothetical protein